MLNNKHVWIPLGRKDNSLQVGLNHWSLVWSGQKLHSLDIDMVLLTQNVEFIWIMLNKVSFCRCIRS